MVIKFDLAVIPADATIIEATLSLYAAANYYEGTNGPKSLYELNSSWSESSITWSNCPTFSSTAIDQNSNSSTKVWEDYAVTTVIKDVVENSSPNNGFILKFDSMTPAHGVEFTSSEGSQSNRPKLTITYEIDDLEAPQVTVTAPTAGVVLEQGANYNITWDATDNVGVVACALYFTDGTRAWELIDSLNSNPGTYAWTVPANATSTTCKVKVNAYDAAGNAGTQESGDFTIEPAASITPYGFNIIPADIYNVKIVNIQGREIASFETKNLIHINKMMTSLSSGVHIIHITTPNQKFSKQIRVVR